MRTNGAGEADVRRTAWTRHAGRARRGSALILVLVMTLSLAGLAISAVLLTSSSMLVQRYYDKDKDFRFFAMAGAALVKSTVQRDTTLTIPTGTPYQALTAATIADASGGTNAAVKVNAYVAYTGDTAGTYIPFLTILAQAYDTMGVRSVQRRDLRSEAYSRYALFTDTSSSSIFPLGQVIRGRMHANRNWTQTATSPGPDFYDTVTVVGSITGTANYHGITAVTGAQRLKWPTTTSLTTLGTLASAGDLTVTPVTPSATFPAYCGQTSGGVDLSGKPSVSANFPCSFFGYTTRMTNGTRIRLRPVDVNNNGTYDAAEGFLEVFDLAPGIDTSSLRADLPTSGATNNNIVIQNQCGLMVTMSTGRREFFPVARFRDPWVLHRIHLNATAPTINWAGGDSATMGGRAGNSPSAAAVNKILTFGVGYSRCFPAGSSYLMLTERYANAAASCTVTTSTGDTPYAWGNSATNCPQYGGQDTTFTVTVTRCRIRDSQQCEDPQVSLGSWRAFGGTSSASPPAAVLQSVETPYLWPISTTYNSASRGVAAYTAGTQPLFLSDTLRGFLTLYTTGRIVLIDDLVYDADPLQSGNLCRNFLGLIAQNEILVANNAINHPRPVPSSAVNYFLGTPHYTIHGILMSLTDSVTTENGNAAEVTTPAITCNGTSTSGGCINLTGGLIAKTYRITTTLAGRGLILNETRDPCQSQQTNRRPPFFPLTGRYVDYKTYEVDPRRAATSDSVTAYMARLRGNNRAVP